MNEWAAGVSKEEQRWITVDIIDWILDGVTVLAFRFSSRSVSLGTAPYESLFADRHAFINVFFRDLGVCRVDGCWCRIDTNHGGYWTLDGVTAPASRFTSRSLSLDSAP